MVEVSTRRVGRLGSVAAVAVAIFLFTLPGVAHASGPFHVTGTVTSQAGGGVQNVSVTATAPGGTTVLFGPASTSTSGSYQLDVSSGTYDFHFDPPSGSGLNPIVSNSVTVTTDQTLNVQLTSPSHVLSGTVRDGAGQPVPSVQMSFQMLSAGSQLTVTTDANGRYSATANAGVYYLTTMSANSGPLGSFSVYNYYGASGLPHYDVTNADLIQDFQLPTTTLAVTVKDGFGVPVANAPVYVYGYRNGYTLMPVNTGDAPGYYPATRSAATNTSGTATLTVFKTSYPAGNICTTVNGNEVCTSATQTINGPSNLLFQSAPQVPPAPTALIAATPTAGAPSLSWSQVSVAASYRVYRNSQLIGTTTSTGFVDSALTVGGSYSYTVTAVSSLNIESPASSAFTVVYTTGPAVSNVAVTPSTITVGRVAVLTATMTDAVAGVAAAEYFEGTDPGEGHGSPMTLAGNTATATLSSTLAVGQHTFTVRGKDSLGNWTRGTLPSVTLTVTLPSLNGRMLNGANEGIAGVRVDLVDPANHQTVIATATSNSAGNYSVSAAPGIYDVIYTPQGDVYQQATKTSVDVTGNNTIDVVLVLVPRTFSGTVKDKYGTAIAGATLTLHNQGGQSPSTTTATDGSFWIQVNQAVYTVSISGSRAAAPLAVIPSSFTLNGGSFDLSQNMNRDFVVPAVNLTFHTKSGLTDASVGVVALAVAVSTSTTLYPGSGAYTGASGYSVTSNASGVATLVVLCGTSYTVTATPLAGSGVVITSFPQSGPVCADTAVELALTADIKQFNGTLVDDSGATIPGATVRLSGPSGTFQAVTAGNGDFSVEAAAGAYSVTVTGSKPSGSSLRLPDSFTFSGGGIDISTGDETRELRIQAAKVDVTAQNSFGTLLPGVSVTVTAVSGSAELYPGGIFTATATSTAVTGTDGIAHLMVLKGLRYTTKATPSAGSGYIVTNRGASPPVTSDTAWTVTLDRDLKSFTGTVRDKHNVPVVGATVRLDGNEADQHYATTTNSVGQFSLQAAPNSSYTLQVNGTRSASPSAYLPDVFALSATTNVTADNVQDVTIDAVELTIIARDDRLVPIPDVSLAFMSAGTHNGFTAVSTTISRTTGSDGRAYLTMLAGTTYTISATPPAGQGYVNTTFNGTSPISQDTTTVIEFQNHIPLTPPDLTAASPTKTAPELHWNSLTSTDHYKIYRDGTEIGTTSTTSFTDTTLTADGRYRYQVSAVNAYGYEGPKSNTVEVVYDTTAPEVGVAAFTTNPKKVGQQSVLHATVTDAGSGPAAGEYFIGATDPGQGNGVAMPFTDGMITATVPANLHPGTYTFHVRVKDVLGTWSAPQTVDLVVTRPAPPTGLTAPSPTNHDPILGWVASPDAVRYYVYRNGVKLTAEPTGTSFTDAGRLDGHDSYYLTAINELGDESDPSNTANVHIDKTAPTISAQVTPTPTAGWNNAVPASVTFTCTDEVGGSGVAMCSLPSSFSEEGIQQVGGIAVDNAGNTRTVSPIPTVKIDLTAPALGLPAWTANPKPAGLTSTATIPAPDPLSGLAAGEYFIDTDPGVGNGIPMTVVGADTLSTTIGTNLTVGVYQIGIRARDTAGNWSQATKTMLVVYDPDIPLGITGKNKNDLVPSLANGDLLPGLTDANQTDAAEYGFTVDHTGATLDPRNDFMLTYNVGTQCHTPHPQNCHSLTMSATGFQWLIIDQTNNSRGRFQGTAAITIDGSTTSNPFTVEGIDGGRLTPSTSDRFTVKIYAPGSDPATATPIYQVSAILATPNSVKVR